MEPVFFTHIPKTASTSLQRAVMYDIPDKNRHRYSGVRNVLLSRRKSFEFLEGHYAYGVHHLYGIYTPKYFVMLRDPVERAISHYYFIRSSDGPDYTHPSIEDVRKNDLVEFYRKPKYQNVQTRFVAGVVWQQVGRYLSLNECLGRRALARAKQNLVRRYEAYGLTERFEKSARLFAARIGGEAQIPEKRYQKTANRPTANELDDGVTRALEHLNARDMALYRFARRRFSRQLDG
jgi:hypothetical protein